jgi:flagellar assembly protein FliH
MSAPERFIPLEDLLRPAPALVPAPVRAPYPEADSEPASELANEVPPADPRGDGDGDAAAQERAVLREVRLFGARLADALDERLARLLAGLASDVLVRELRTAPADLAALVARIAAEATAPPLRVRVAPGDREAAAACGVPVEPDPALAPGDAIVDFADGAIDARLGVRLAALLEALR